MWYPVPETLRKFWCDWSLTIMDAVPTEIWQHIFALACTDSGYTGRSLSLVSTKFQGISAPFKYQSLVITHWSQILAFAHMFFWLPASQKRIKYLFVHHPYPLLDIDGKYPSIITGTSPTTSDDESQSNDDIWLVLSAAYRIGYRNDWYWVLKTLTNHTSNRPVLKGLWTWKKERNNELLTQ